MLLHSLAGASGESHDLCEPQFLTCKGGMTEAREVSLLALERDTQEMLSLSIKYLRFWGSWGSSLFSLSLDFLRENRGASLDLPGTSERSPLFLPYESTQQR